MSPKPHRRTARPRRRSLLPAEAGTFSDSVTLAAPGTLGDPDMDDDALQPDTAAPPLRSHLTTRPTTEEDGGARLDKWLADAVPDLSRSRLKALIEAGHVTIDGVTIEDASHRVKPGQIATVDVPEATTANPLPQPMPLEIVYEDDYLIVIDKPPGMVVHPAPGSPDGTLVNALLHHCGASLSGIGGVRRPGIVHRIDKDTSGLLVAAKSDTAHQGLSTQFSDRTVNRAYWALVWGTPRPSAGEVEGNIGRSPTNRQKMAVVKRGGKIALTRYRTVSSFLGGAVSLIECRLATGRTHQIRVHMAHVGHTLVGDPLYGSSRRKGITADAQAMVAGFDRQALHAHLLGFVHPITGETLTFNSPLPEDMRALIERLNGGE
ncbi:MAG: RluA family pseudouridine synthase [Rhodospirillaceae bacterium]